MDKKEEEEFEGLLEVDKTRLDEECENHPYLVWKYGKETAKATEALDIAKAELKVVEAEVDIAIREDPTDYDLDGDKKPTEAAIRAAIPRSKEYKEAHKKLLNATYRLNMLEAANKALDHRRTTLTILNGLDERGYFVRPQQKRISDTGKSRIRKPLRKKK